MSNCPTMKDVDETADSVRAYVNVTDGEEKAQNSIDEGLYSRQLYVMGHEAQKRMGDAKVLIIGLNGVGVEISKNIILAGVKSVVLCDDTPTSFMDLSSQFYLNEKDIGCSRAQACFSKLSELNPYVEVSTYSGDLTEEYLRTFKVVIMIDALFKKAMEVNDLCHKHSIPFITADARGVFASVFCDFGSEFVVFDKDGEQAIECMIASISNESPSLVTVTDDARHRLETGDYVTFREVVGMDELNGCEPREVTVTGPYTFTVGNVSGKYEKGGYVTQVKQPLKLSFNPLSKAITSPGEFLMSDFGKIGRPEVLHQAFRGLDRFREENGCFPTPGNKDHANRVFEYAVAINKEGEGRGEFHVSQLEDHKTIIDQLAFGSSGVISPMAAFLGGVVGQEALKACSGKFTPIKQFFYFDAVETLPENTLPAEECAPQGCRYDSQIVVFGRQFQAQLLDLNLFLVGAGAIGCEMLKNWALMGVGCGEKGLIHVTDMDIIEKSNLNRQFLFRSSDVQQAKSTTAAKAINNMNPNVKVKSYVDRVGTETESTFDDDFYESLHGVCTALDNVDARLYMDQRCLFYQLPMFESGTLGTKGNTQIVVPKITENYGASRDPPEKSIPICTLKNFPNAIEHTLQWARDWFEGVFFQSPSDVNQYLSQSEFVSNLNSQPNTKLETLERLRDSLITHKPLSFDECIVWARVQFEDMFSNQIKQLLHNFPLDQVTSSGTLFWSGPKRPPQPIVFDPKDPLHLDFIISVANSRALNYGLVGRNDREYFLSVLPNTMVPEFVPKEGVKIATTESEMKENSNADADDIDSVCERIISELPKPASLAGYRMVPLEFEKDDDSHMAVIVAASNLRARNYRIPEADLHKSRFIAGKIIPAIATTTALVTGLVCLEMIKVFQKKKLEQYKNGFVNLALPLFAFSEPIQPHFTKSSLNGEEYNWSPWDRLDMDIGDITLKEFLAYFETKYGLEISMLSHGVSILHAMFSKKSKIEERLPMKMTELVRKVTKKDINPQQKFLIFEICAMDAEGEDVDLPYVRYRFRK